MRLLGVEQEDVVRDLGLGNHQRHDRLRSELLHRREAMIPVRRPVQPVVGRHCDDRIEVPSELVDGLDDAADMRVRQVALEGSWLDAVDGQRGKELPMTSEGVAIGCEDGAAVLLDRS